MNDTVSKLMGMIDDYADERRLGFSWEDVQSKRQALEAELIRLFTPLTDEQIKQATGAGGEYWASSKIYIKAIFQAAEQAHGITGEKNEVA